MKLSEIDLTGVETLLLDRDGVINKLRPNDYVKTWEEFEFLPGVLEALTQISKKVKHIFIVTNQRGVGKGLMTEADLEDIHQRMVEEIAKSGGKIDKIYYCTAVDPSNSFRKPNIGMWQQIQNQYPAVNPLSTLMVGDSESDMDFAKNCGIRGIKVNG